MTRSSAVLSVLALFVAGFVAGALAMHLYEAPGGGDPRAPWGEHGRGPLAALDLTAEQQQRIHEILDESRVHADALREEIAPRIREQMERTHERIREVLTPEQRQRLDEWREHRPRRFDRFFLGHGPAPWRERAPRGEHRRPGPPPPPEEPGPAGP